MSPRFKCAVYCVRINGNSSVFRFDLTGEINLNSASIMKIYNLIILKFILYFASMGAYLGYLLRSSIRRFSTNPTGISWASFGGEFRKQLLEHADNVSSLIWNESRYLGWHQLCDRTQCLIWFVHLKVAFTSYT